MSGISGCSVVSSAISTCFDCSKRIFNNLSATNQLVRLFYVSASRINYGLQSPTLTPLLKDLKVFSQFVSARNWVSKATDVYTLMTGGISETPPRHLDIKDPVSYWLVLASKISLLLCDLCSFAYWLANQSVLQLAKLSSSIGETRAYTIFGYNLCIIQTATGITGAVLDLINNGYMFYKSGFTLSSDIMLFTIMDISKISMVALVGSTTGLYLALGTIASLTYSTCYLTWFLMRTARS